MGAEELVVSQIAVRGSDGRLPFWGIAGHSEAIKLEILSGDYDRSDDFLM